VRKRRISMTAVSINISKIIRRILIRPLLGLPIVLRGTLGPKSIDFDFCFILLLNDIVAHLKLIHLLYIKIVCYR
jgi:hypothetical protein